MGLQNGSGISIFSGGNWKRLSVIVYLSVHSDWLVFDGSLSWWTSVKPRISRALLISRSGSALVNAYIPYLGLELQVQQNCNSSFKAVFLGFPALSSDVEFQETLLSIRSALD